MRNGIWGYAGSRVVDREAGLGLLTRHADVNLAVGRRKFDRIVEQVEEQSREPLFVTHHRYIARALVAQVNGFGLCDELNLIDDCRSERVEIHSRSGESDLTGLGSREHQNLINEPLEPVDLLELARQLPSGGFRAVRITHRELDIASQRRQGRAQLVRERRTELPHLAHRLLQARERLVERRDHRIEFIACPTRRQPPLQGRHIDGARNLSNLRERA